MNLRSEDILTTCRISSLKRPLEPWCRQGSPHNSDHTKFFNVRGMRVYRHTTLKQHNMYMQANTIYDNFRGYTVIQNS